MKFFYRILPVSFYLFCLAQTAQAVPPPDKGFAGGWKTEERATRYITPSRFLWSGGKVSLAEQLLNPGDTQLTTNPSGSCILENKAGTEKASVLIDFGKELQGGIRISAALRTDQRPARIRVRLGESVSEAMSETAPEGTATNDHAMRDFILELPWLGQAVAGHSGFRFARIDLLEEDYILPIKSVEAVFMFRDIPYLGTFQCNDQRLNDIWETGAYTVHLNMQDYVWDGIKRDRLVWLGDLHPELMTINTVFGDSPVLRATLDFGRDHAPLPGWMNGMCSYSLWWIISHRDLYLYRGDLDFLLQQQDYLNRLADQIIREMDGNRERLSGKRFLDWPTSENEEIIDAGLHSLTILALDAAREIGQWINDTALSARCEAAVSQLRTHTPNHHGNKQAAALLSLSGLEPAEKMSRDIISRDGAHRFSTFYGYYMLEAMAKAGDYDGAIRIISDYWGAMLDLGATTFWEDLDYAHALKAARIDELIPPGQFDIHSQSGDYCYKGFRHSFCHGWASGPTAWLSRHVLGINPVAPGCKTVEIDPHLGSLEWAKGSFPTPYGLIEIEHTRQENGKVSTRLSAPVEVEILTGTNIEHFRRL